MQLYEEKGSSTVIRRGNSHNKSFTKSRLEEFGSEHKDMADLRKSGVEVATISSNKVKTMMGSYSKSPSGRRTT